MSRPEPNATTAPANAGSQTLTDRRGQTKGEAALVYARHLGWHVFPVWNVVDGRCQCGKPGCKDPGKHPHSGLITNQPKGHGGYKQATDDVAKVRAWWRTDPNANVGIRTGRVSGIVVLDVDSEAAMTDLRRRGLPPTLVASTGRPGGGWHVYLAYPTDLGLDRIASPNEFLPGVDLRADDSSVVPPPSSHHSGRVREWIASGPPEQRIGPCPEWLKDEMRSHAKAARPATSDGTEPTSGLTIDPSANPPWLLDLVASDEEFRTVWLGRRRDLPSLSEHRLSLADRLARVRGSDQDVLDGLVAFDRQHGRTPEPLETYAKEIEKARAAAKAAGRRGRRGESQSATLKGIFEARRPRFGRDQDDVPYVRLGGDDGQRVLPLEGAELRDWLAWAYRTEAGEAASPQTIASLLASYRHDCQAGERYVACTRTVMEGDSLYVDHMADGDRCLVIRGGRVEEGVVPRGVVFRRPRHLRPYGDIDLRADPSEVWRLLDLINAPVDEASKVLLLVWAITGFLPHVPRPLLVLTGVQGSAKTTASRYLRRLIDPSSYRPLAPPANERELAVQLADCYMMVYDNVSNLNPIADGLCRAVTGDTIVHRKLYTDSEAVVFRYRPLIAVNGIDIPITQPDLLDRCLTISLPAVPAGRRKLEREADAEFEAARPRILGACLRIVAEVTAIPVHHPADLPRLADWAAYGAEVAQRLGVAPERFLDHYRGNASRNREHAVESNLFVSLVCDLVVENAHPDWEVRPMDLLAMASMRAGEIGADPRRDPKWPGDEGWVTKRLRASEVDLQELGISFERRVPLPGHKKGLRFTFSPPAGEDADTRDGAGE